MSCLFSGSFWESRLSGTLKVTPLKLHPVLWKMQVFPEFQMFDWL